MDHKFPRRLITALIALIILVPPLWFVYITLVIPVKPTETAPEGAEQHPPAVDIVVQAPPQPQFQRGDPVVSGGLSNQVAKWDSTVSGGANNKAVEIGSTVSGGKDNQALGVLSSIGGGRFNVASGAVSRVAGGAKNNANANGATISGGKENTAAAEFTAIGGGSANWAAGPYSGVFSGKNHEIQLGFGFIGGGESNLVMDIYNTIGGGTMNVTKGYASTVGGGAGNAAMGAQSTASGGWNNLALGDHAVAPGGYNNTAQGDYSFAAGNKAHAKHRGTFVWSDASGQALQSDTENQLKVRASGGISLLSSQHSGVTLPPGSGSWASLSSKDAKTAFSTVESSEILEKIAELPVTTWSYREESSEIAHLGPTAEDFHHAFGLGASPSQITTVDADGVALKGIQALYERLIHLEKEVKTLRKENETLKEAINHAPFNHRAH